jgi:hypothetical protein
MSVARQLQKRFDNAWNITLLRYTRAHSKDTCEQELYALHLNSLPLLHYLTYVVLHRSFLQEIYRAKGIKHTR